MKARIGGVTSRKTYKGVSDTEKRISQDNEQIMTRIRELMDPMFTMSEIAAQPTLDQVWDLIEPHKQQLEEGLQNLKQYKEELDNLPDFDQRMADSHQLQQAYEDMVEIIDNWEIILH